MMKEQKILFSTQISSSWKDHSDREIWSAFLDGNKGAFQFIYEQYIEELFNYGMKIRSNRSLVKDCIHDVFVELWSRKTFLSFTDNIRFYLYRSLRRKMIQVIDRDKKLYENTSIENYSSHLSILPSEHHLIQAQTELERKRRIELLLQKLSSRQQEVIRLLFFGKMSYEQVSEIMAINVKSVYTLAWKAISAIRKALPVLLLLVVL